jgi:hypothetical protein
METGPCDGVCGYPECRRLLGHGIKAAVASGGVTSKFVSADVRHAILISVAMEKPYRNDSCRCGSTSLNPGFDGAPPWRCVFDFAHMGRCGFGYERIIDGVLVHAPVELCPHCGGRGWGVGECHPMEECGACDGTGRVLAR